jgi:hypothetical protein
MLETAGLSFYKAGRAFGCLRQNAEDAVKTFGGTKVIPPDSNILPSPAALRATMVGKFLEYFPLLNAQVERYATICESEVTFSDIQYHSRALDERFEDELKDHWFYWVPKYLVKYYQDMMPFGLDVNDRFPSAIDDIEGAAKCLALGQGTAVVLHLMRVMEVGLRALSLALGIPYAPSWESHLKQIQTKVAEKHKTKGVRWKRDEKLFIEISGDLLSVKQAWRNPTMHVERKYGSDEAEEIFRAVRTFMVLMSTRFSEVSRRRA